MDEIARIDEAKLLGLLWNEFGRHTSTDFLQPLWWCISPELKAEFRAAIVVMADPSARPSDGARFG